MRISDWSSDVCSSDLDIFDPILLQHIDRPLAAKQRTVLHQPQPGRSRAWRDRDDLRDPFQRSAVAKLFEREDMLARPGEQRDHLAALRPIVEGRGGDATTMERARSGYPAGPFPPRHLGRAGGKGA